MSFLEAKSPEVAAPGCRGLELAIVPRPRDLGGLTVSRVLPSGERRMVGPFVFFDHMGPAVFAAGHGIDVRPHPHIGLATVTWLFAGEIMHRDSLGFEQPIRPGELNWMTAGRGIVHSERTAPEVRREPSELHGIQAWVALPLEHEETAPTFAHYPAAAMKQLELDGVRIQLIAGTLFGEESPVATHSPLFYAQARLDAGAQLRLPPEHEERAVYVVEGRLELAGDVFEAGRMLVFRPGDEIALRARESALLMLLGGAPLGPRHIWWNFVSSSRERIERAKADWAEGRFAGVPGDDERIPLPA